MTESRNRLRAENRQLRVEKESADKKRIQRGNRLESLSSLSSPSAGSMEHIVKWSDDELNKIYKSHSFATYGMNSWMLYPGLKFDLDFFKEIGKE